MTHQKCQANYNRNKNGNQEAYYCILWLTCLGFFLVFIYITHKNNLISTYEEKRHSVNMWEG